MTKDEERIKYKGIRKEIDKTLSNKIVTNFLMTKKYQNSNTVLIYYPLEGEVNTLPIIKKALKDNKKVALPKCNDDNTMNFYYINTILEVKEGKHHIMEPTTNKLVTNFNDSICIVPGIAFDKNYNRLGYGKGYYDRFLKDYTGLKIGLCYDELLLNKISTDIHDIPVDMIVTEKSIY